MNARIIAVAAAFVLILATHASQAQNTGAVNRSADPEGVRMHQIQTGRMQDPELVRRMENFRQNYGAEIEELRHQRTEAIRRANNGSYSEKQRRHLIAEAELSFRRLSTLSHRQHRQPVEDHIRQLANHGVKSANQIGPGLGKSPTVTGPDGIERINDAYSGESDTDVSSGLPAKKNMANIARAHGFDVTEHNNTVSISEGGDRPYFDMTLNVHAKTDSAGGGGLAARRGSAAGGDAMGSQSQEQVLRDDAADGERYLFPEMKPSPIRDAVEMQDHLKKAGVGNAVVQEHGAAALLQDNHRDDLQIIGKATKKMSGAVPDADIQRSIDRHGLDMTVGEYRASLENTHGRATQDTTNVNRRNIDAWVAVSSEVQNQAVDNTANRAHDYVQQARTEVVEMEARLKNDPNMPAAERNRLLDEVGRRREALVDGRQRWQAASEVNNRQQHRADTAANDAFNMPMPRTPGGPSPARAGLNRAGAKGFRVAGTVMGVYSKASLGLNLTRAAVNGDVGAIGGIILEEAWDEVKDRALERILPGAGQLRLAWEVGHMTGRFIGENVKLCPGCPTVDQAAQNFFEEWHDILSGNREQRWEQKHLNAKQAFVNEMIDEWGSVLPPGMTRGQAFQYAMVVEQNGGSFHQALEGVFDEGDRQVKILGDLRDAQAQAQADADAAAQRMQTTLQENENAAENALSAFNQNLEAEQNAGQGPRASGSGLQGALGAGGQAARDVAAYQAEVAAIEDRRRAREEEAKEENDQFWNDFAQVMGAVGNAAAQMQAQMQAQQQAQQQASQVGRSSGSGGWKPAKPAYTPPPPRQPPAKPRVRRTVQRSHNCIEERHACVKRRKCMSLQGIRSKVEAFKRCINECGDLRVACLKRLCPNGLASGGGTAGSKVAWCYVD